MTRSLLLAALSTVAALALTAPASAGVLSFDGTRYTYDAGQGETNDLRVTYYPGSGEMYFDDRVQIVGDANTPASCDYVMGDQTQVTCPLVEGPVIDLGDGDDYATGGAGREEIHGGPGNDDLRGDGGDDVLEGGPGDDVFEKGSPATRAGDDVIVGGDGVDEAWYTSDFYSGTEPVRVTLDGVANDGMTGEADNVQTENVRGSEKADVLIGDGGPNHLDGGSGEDEIRGGGGNDFVDGNVDADRVYGEAGDDKVYGGDSANDLVDGGAGRDEIVADGICFYSGCNSGGNDTIAARDGEPDTIDCGGGYDSGNADAADHLTGGLCEALDIAGSPPCCSTGGQTGRSFDLSAPKRVGYRQLVRRGLAVGVRCDSACRIDATLLLGRSAIGRARRTIAGAGTARLPVRVQPGARRRLAHARSLTLRVRVAQGATSTTKSRRVQVRR
jgi:Ca2+-binding RTX toxin-like protein